MGKKPNHIQPIIHEESRAVATAVHSLRLALLNNGIAFGALFVAHVTRDEYGFMFDHDIPPEHAIKICDDMREALDLTRLYWKRKLLEKLKAETNGERTH